MIDLIKTAAGFFFIGALAGVLLTIYFFNQDENYSVNSMSVKQISGDAIEHTKFSTTGSNISFTTTSHGSGVIETQIPKNMIPEAKNWIERINGISFVGGYSLNRQSSYSVMYWRRFNRISIGAGMQATIGSRIDPGVCLGGMWWW
jgi:hypothetical protein